MGVGILESRVNTPGNCAETPKRILENITTSSLWGNVRVIYSSDGNMQFRESGGVGWDSRDMSSNVITLG